MVCREDRSTGIFKEGKINHPAVMQAVLAQIEIGGIEFVGDLRLVARQVDRGGPADAGRVPEEAEGDFFRVTFAAGGADLELERAVFNDGDGRGFDVDFERCLGGDGGGDAVEGNAVEGSLFVDVDVVDGVGEAADKKSGWFQCRSLRGA